MACRVTTTSEMIPVAKLNGSAMIGLGKIGGVKEIRCKSLQFYNP